MTTVRAATAMDAADISRLLEQLGYSTPAADVPARLAAIEEEGGVALVAVDDDAGVIGLATASHHAALHAVARVAYITALVIDARVRGRGVGRTIVGALEQWALARGCGAISVTSAEHRADAHAFYPRCGLPYTGRRFTKKLGTPR